jgi:hypothetical protein
LFGFASEVGEIKVGVGIEEFRRVHRCKWCEGLLGSRNTKCVWAGAPKRTGEAPVLPMVWCGSVRSWRRG